MPVNGEGTTSHRGLQVLGAHGWRDQSMYVFGLCVSESSPANIKPEQPASRISGLGARYQISHNFGMDTGETIDIIRETSKCSYIQVLYVESIKCTKSKPGTLGNDTKAMSHYGHFTHSLCTLSVILLKLRNKKCLWGETKQTPKNPNP